MTEKNNSFVFYKSFYDAMQILENDDKTEFINLICRLAFYGEEAEFEKLNVSDIVKVLYTVSAEQVKASIKHRQDGSSGGRPRKENEEKKGVKTPLFTNVNVNDNVNVKVNVNDNDNVNDNKAFIDSSLFFTQNQLNTLLQSAGYNLKEKALKNTYAKIAKYDNPQNFIESRINYINQNYKDKTQDEKNALLFSSLDWQNIEQKPARKDKKHTKKQDPADMIPPPEKCTHCGGKLEKWAGIPHCYFCPTCAVNGKRIFWELEGNEYKSNRRTG